MVPLVLWAKPFFPLDETRYLGVAWEMFFNKEFILPTLNGEPYSHKPPLLFWLICAGWSVFGVNSWWPQLIPLFFSLGCMFLLLNIAKTLWPEEEDVISVSPYILLSTVFFAGFSTLVMFDVMLMFFAELTVLGAVLRWKKGHRLALAAMGAGIGLGILTKGPVILMTVLPVLIAVPWLQKGARPAAAGWYKDVSVAFMLGACIALLWAVPAAVRGGEQFANDIFLSQSTERVVDSFAHKRPVWFYLAAMPVLLFPWSFWPPLWNSLQEAGSFVKDPGFRLCCVWLAVPFILFSCISSKQPHYLLPAVPAFVLMAGYAVLKSKKELKGNNFPVGVLFILLGAGTIFIFLREPFDFIPYVKEFAGRDKIGWLYFAAAFHIIIGIGAIVLKFPTMKKELKAVAAKTVVFFLVMTAFHLRVVGSVYDVTKISRFVAQAMEEGRPVAIDGKYMNQFHFLGRVKGRVDSINANHFTRWAKDNPRGVILIKRKELTENDKRKGLLQVPYIGKYMVVRQASDYL